jgi:hypothetical protein
VRSRLLQPPEDALPAAALILQAIIAGFRYELHILDVTPMGGMIRIATGDTIMDDLRAEQERCTAELEAIQQEQGDNQVCSAARGLTRNTLMSPSSLASCLPHCGQQTMTCCATTHRAALTQLG